MPEFISKLQYKNYEKSEFSDEKTRSLDETTELIKAFPWGTERGTDIQLTCPSVTICNEYGEYLKAALYFNGKYCVYFLDHDCHLYELHVQNLGDVIKGVTGFFDGLIDLKRYEKHLFNVGNRAHFETGRFEYRMRLSRALWVNGLILGYGMLFLAFNIASFKTGVPAIFPGFITAFVCFYFWILFRIFRHVYRYRNCYLQISKGCDIFSFGMDDNNIKAYSKKNIKEIIEYESRGSRSPNFIEIFDIVFNDDSETITISNMLLNGSYFLSKFSDNLDNPYVKTTISGKSSFKKL